MQSRIRRVRRDEITRALYHAIRQHGVRLPSFDAVAKEGDTSRQLVRHYYKNSEEMAADLCDVLAVTYRDSLTKCLSTVSDHERLKTILDFYFNAFASQGLPKPVDDQVYDALFSCATASIPIRKSLKSQYSTFQTTLAQEIRATYPDISEDKNRDLAFAIMSYIYGHWKMIASLGFSTSYHQSSRELLDTFISSAVNEATSAKGSDIKN